MPVGCTDIKFDPVKDSKSRAYFAAMQATEPPCSVWKLTVPLSKVTVDASRNQVDKFRPVCEGHWDAVVDVLKAYMGNKLTQKTNDTGAPPQMINES